MDTAYYKGFDMSEPASIVRFPLMLLDDGNTLVMIEVWGETAGCTAARILSK